MKRSVEITVETDEVVLFNRDPSAVRMLCPACGRLVPMLSPEQAARIVGVTARRAYAWVEARRVHFVETREGSLLLCADSLARAAAALGKYDGQQRSRGIGP